MIEYVNKIFLSKKHRDDMLLLIGPPNTGKASIIADLYRKVDKRVYQFSKIDLTRKIRRNQFFKALDGLLHRKSNRRKGMLQGR